jgi:hypothetical protein
LASLQQDKCTGVYRVNVFFRFIFKGTVKRTSEVMLDYSRTDLDDIDKDFPTFLEILKWPLIRFHFLNTRALDVKPAFFKMTLAKFAIKRLQMCLRS